MKVALILYGIFAIAVLLLTTAPRVRVKYIPISRVTLDSFMRRCDNFLVIEPCEANKPVIPAALWVPADQLSGLLRWVPPGSTLVLSDLQDGMSYRDCLADDLFRFASLTQRLRVFASVRNLHGQLAFGF
jgi:hypothetical protein